MNMVNNSHTSFLLELAEMKNLDDTVVILKNVPRNLTFDHLRYAFRAYDLVDEPGLAIQRTRVGFVGFEDKEKNMNQASFEYQLRFKDGRGARQFVRENMELILDGKFVYVTGFRD